MRAEVSGVRLSVLSVVVLGLFGALFARLWFLQVAAAPGLEQAVAQGHERTVILPPTRGRIVDIEGRVLADNKPSLAVVVDQNQLRRKDSRLALWQLLAGPLNISIADLEERYNSPKFERLEALPVAENITEQTAIYIKERSENFPGVDIIEMARREYRYGPLAAHIVGYVGFIQKEDWTTYKGKGYRLSDRVGVTGIEQSFEEVLRGKAGFKRVEVDNVNRVVREIERVEPIPGNDVQLTIDLKLQQYTEQILAIELRKRAQERPNRPIDIRDGKEFGPEKPFFPATVGSVVITDVQTGAVVAMASNPTFDPRWYDGVTPAAKLDELFGYEKNPDGTTRKLNGQPVAKNNGPIFNRAVSGQYAIGSTMKLFTALAAMRYGLLDPDKDFDDAGKWTMPNCNPEDPGGCLFRNAGGASYGKVKLSDALMVSSDAYFYELGARLYLETQAGTDPLQTELRLFGFDKRTGIQLPGEQPGLIPDKAVKKRMADQGAITRFAGSDYFVGDNVNLAIGQGLIGVTPLQLANGYATFANGGIHYAPRIAKAIYEAGSPLLNGGRIDLSKAKLIQSFEPVVVNTIELPADMALPVLDGLSRVVSTDRLDNGNGATAKDAFKGYDQDRLRVWGKTGTAQTDKEKDERDTSLFVSFGGPPDGQPKWAMAAVLEDSGFGGRAAAPVTRCIWEALGQYDKVAEPKQSEPLDKTNNVPAVIPMIDSTIKTDFDASCLLIEFEQTRSVGRE